MNDWQKEELEGRLLALEHLIGQLLRLVPAEQKAAMLAEARARFTGHTHMPHADAAGTIVVNAAFGVPGAHLQGG